MMSGFDTAVVHERTIAGRIEIGFAPAGAPYGALAYFLIYPYIILVNLPHSGGFKFSN